MPRASFALPAVAVAFSFLVAAAVAPACSSNGNPSVGLGDAGADALGPPPPTSSCMGDMTACLSGTVKAPKFNPSFLVAKVNLFRVYPYGAVSAVQTVQVAQDGTFALSNVAPWTHYYLQAVGLFESTHNGNAVAAVVGPFTVPVTGGPIPIEIKPVFLEVLQQRPTGGQTSLAWASAHVYDPASGAELTNATVSFTSGSQTWPMPYAANAGGSMSYFATIPPGVAGGTAFTITTSAMALGGSPLTWSLVGEPATFDGAVTSPAPGATVPVNSPLTVTWMVQPAASHTVVELFRVQGMNNDVAVYQSPAAVASDVTMETVPGSALSMPGAYLLNVAYSKATCPTTADGCVYNNSTAPLDFMAQ